MEEDLKKLDDLFDSILEEIIHPEKAGTFRNPFIGSGVKRITGLAESMIMISVKVSADNMRAMCTVSAGSDKHKAFTAEDIMREVSAAGVFYGINDSAINAMVSAQVVNMAVEIASGIPAVNGTDGSLYLKVGLSDEGTTVEKGTEVCHVLMPKPGRDGMDVRGRVLPAAPGKEVVFDIGEGLFRRGNRVYADCDGRFILREGQYSVVNEKVIDKDVDHNMGVVAFEGSIVINGDVLAKSVIHAGGSVTVRGKVTSSVIEAAHNVTIEGRTIDSSISSADGNIKGSVFYDGTIVSGGKIVAEVIENCTVKSVYGIDCLTGAGRITGGEIFCSGNINCLLVGNREHIETRLIMGSHDEYSKEIEEIDGLIRRIDKDISKIMVQVNEIRSKEKDGTATLEDESFLEAALRVRAQKISDKTPLTERLKKLREIVKMAQNATLRAKTLIYGGTVVKIDKFSQLIHADRPHPTVRSNGSAIVMT